MGKKSYRPPLPIEMAIIDKIKIYAHEGFMSRGEGTEEKFERLWQEAFPIKKKGSKR